MATDSPWGLGMRLTWNMACHTTSRGNLFAAKIEHRTSSHGPANRVSTFGWLSLSCSLSLAESSVSFNDVSAPFEADDCSPCVCHCAWVRFQEILSNITVPTSTPTCGHIGRCFRVRGPAATCSGIAYRRHNTAKGEHVGKRWGRLPRLTAVGQIFNDLCPTQRHVRMPGAG